MANIPNIDVTVTFIDEKKREQRSFDIKLPDFATSLEDGFYDLELHAGWKLKVQKKC